MPTQEQTASPVCRVGGGRVLGLATFRDRASTSAQWRKRRAMRSLITGVCLAIAVLLGATPLAPGVEAGALGLTLLKIETEFPRVRATVSVTSSQGRSIVDLGPRAF